MAGWESLEVPRREDPARARVCPRITQGDAADELPCSICNLPLLLHRLCKEEKELKMELQMETRGSDAWRGSGARLNPSLPREAGASVPPEPCVLLSCPAQSETFMLHLGAKIIFINLLRKGDIKTQFNCKPQDYSVR